jgi:hypothetical protein
MNASRIARLAPASLLLALALAAPALALDLGAAAPKSDVRMKNVDGKLVSIASLPGPKGKLVLFTCNHCPWVRAWEDRIVRIAADAKKSSIGVVAINANDPSAYPEDSYDKMKERAKRSRYGFPYVVDATSEVARAFGASHTPEAFLFDAEGKLVYHGAIDDNAREPGKVTAHWLADAVAATASGRPVPNAETKSLGCSIKFRGTGD